MPSLWVYAFLDQLRWPKSYVGRLLLIAFLGTHVLLAGLLPYIATAQTTWSTFAPILAVALGATLLGTGSTFRVTIPRTLPDTQAQSTTPLATVSSPNSNARN